MLRSSIRNNEHPCPACSLMFVLRPLIGLVFGVFEIKAGLSSDASSRTIDYCDKPWHGSDLSRFEEAIARIRNGDQVRRSTSCLFTDFLEDRDCIICPAARFQLQQWILGKHKDIVRGDGSRAMPPSMHCHAARADR